MMTVMRPERWGMRIAWPEERFDRVFRDMVRDFFARGMMLDRFFEGWPDPLHVEEYVENGTCVIRAELPGIDPEKDVELEVSEGMLRVSAKREERKEEERPAGYRSEFRYGSFERRIPLPEGATETDVKASYMDGILEVRVPIPKVEEKTPTKVPIEIEHK